MRTASLTDNCFIDAWDLAGSSRRTFVAFLRLEATQELQLLVCDIWNAFVSFRRAGAHQRDPASICVIPAGGSSQRDSGRYLCDFRRQGLTESSWQTSVSFLRAGAHRELLADICVISAGRGSLAAPGMYLCRLPACRPIEEPHVPFPPVWRTGPHQGVIRALPAGLADRIPLPVSRTDLGDHVRGIKARAHLNF